MDSSFPTFNSSSNALFEYALNKWQELKDGQAHTWCEKNFNPSSASKEILDHCAKAQSAIILGFPALGSYFFTSGLIDTINPNIYLKNKSWSVLKLISGGAFLYISECPPELKLPIATVTALATAILTAGCQNTRQRHRHRA